MYSNSDLFNSWSKVSGSSASFSLSIIIFLLTVLFTTGGVLGVIVIEGTLLVDINSTSGSCSREFCFHISLGGGRGGDDSFRRLAVSFFEDDENYCSSSSGGIMRLTIWYWTSSFLNWSETVELNESYPQSHLRAYLGAVTFTAITGKLLAMSMLFPRWCLEVLVP
ncbi:hypothetical protein CDAR_516721 [Caerostris darwini]|uniref:Uncharacterized protein n=1 Tax=Caerostris darwini TaxID=1538125 RepID=A0AAV4WU18_9ARAC|nr:hypothetical protein CDAR_516721 [Caerostris darwini]